MSELLGKGTIDKKSSGETKGKQGSSSRNYDVLGRELFTPDEVRKLDNKKCLIFIRGFDPIIDNKYNPFKHPAFAQTADGKGKAYTHEPSKRARAQPYKILSKKALEYYEALKQKQGNIYIDALSYEEFCLLTEKDMRKRFLSQEESRQKEKVVKEQGNELQYAPDEKMDTEKTAKTGCAKQKEGQKAGKDSIMQRVAQWNFSKEQKLELHKMMAFGVPQEEILKVFYPETDVDTMRTLRKKYQSGDTGAN